MYRAFDMQICVDKTKVMKVSRNGGEINISIDGQKVEQVSSSTWAPGSRRMEEVK